MINSLIFLVEYNSLILSDRKEKNVVIALIIGNISLKISYNCLNLNIFLMNIILNYFHILKYHFLQ